MKERPIYLIIALIITASVLSYGVVEYINYKQAEWDRADREYKQAWKDVHIAADSLSMASDSLLVTYDSLIASYKRYQKVLNELNESLDRQLKLTK